MSQQNTRVSRASQASLRSAGSRHSYKTVSHHSDVDESLFGESYREKKLRENRDARSKSKSPECAPGPGPGPGPFHPILHSPDTHAATGGRQKPEVVQVITKDLIRKIRIPRPEDPSGQTIILDKTHLDRIVGQSAVVTKDDLQLQKEKQENIRNELQDHVQKRKKEFQAIELARRTNEKSDLEKESEDTREMLIQRSKHMVEEQDDEIKKLNEVILNAKCHAIRDAQLAEKAILKQDIDQEEKRLGTIMEVDRLKALQEYERREQERHRQRLLGAQVIQQQIKDREQDRLLESEKKDQETKVMLEYLERLQIEDIKEMEEKVTRQNKLMAEISVSNEEIQRQKLLQKEHEKLAEMKVLEYIKEKEAREEAYQKEQERQAAEKEKEIARLRQQQERAKDVQAEKDALRAKRNQEQFERDWRKKQKETMEKKADNDRLLKEARQQQINDKEHFLSLQAQRDRAEFSRVLQVQQELQQKDQELQKEHASKNKAYSEQVRKQVKSKEEDRLQVRREFFEEGIKLDQEAKDRRKKLDEIKMRKLQELKDAGIPTKYTAEDASQLKSEYLAKFLSIFSSSKTVVFYFCRKATRKVFQREFGQSLCGLLQFSIQKYILDSRDKHSTLDTRKLINHINSYLKARYLQSDDSTVQWTSQLRVLTFLKAKGDRVLGIRFRQIPIKAIDATLSEDSPSTVPIITEIIPDTPAAACPCLWVNDHLLCIKGYVYSDLQTDAKQLESVIVKCSYIQIVVQRAVRSYGPERIAFIAGKRQKFGITFTEKKNLYQGKLSAMISGFSPRAESEYLDKGLELKSIILSINDRTLSDLPLSEGIPILLQESLLQEQIKIKFTNLQKFIDGIKRDPGIGLALVTQPGLIPKLVLKESPSLPLMGAALTDDPLRSVFTHDAQQYNYLKVYILGVHLFEDVYELVGRLLHESTRPRVSPLEDTCFQRPDFSPDLYPNCSLLDQLFRSASSEERVITELDLDSEWRPVCYTPVLSSLTYPPNPSVRSPAHKPLGDSPPHHRTDAGAPCCLPIQETGYGLKRPVSISLITPSSSSSSLSSESAPDLLVRCDLSCPLPKAAISLVLFRNTRELSSLSPPDLFPLFKRSGLYVMVINLEKLFSFLESELHFYLRMLTELHSLPFADPVKVFIVGLYDSLADQTVRSFCWSLHRLFESLFNSHVVLDSKRFETCVFPICRSDRNMDTVHVLRQTLLAFSRGGSAHSETEGGDLTGMLRVPDNFNKFRVCSLLQSTVPVLLSEQIGHILLETELPDHQLEIALSALIECTPFLAPDTLSSLNEDGLLLRPGIFLRVLRQLEKWSGGEGLDRYPEQREICKQLRESCYFHPTVLIHAIMQCCFKLSHIARALLRWMEKLNFVYIIGGPISSEEFEKYSLNKSMTPKPGHKNIKIFMPSISQWNDYKKVDSSTIFSSEAHIFYLDVSDPISSRFYFLFLTELLRAVHRSNLSSLSPVRGDLGRLPLYDFQLFRGATIARLFDQELLGCNLEIINHQDQFQIEFRAKFGSTPSKALPSLLMRIYSCAGRALSKMSLTDKAFNISIGPACAVEGCPGKRKTAALSKATVNFVQVIKRHHPIKYQGSSISEVRGSLPCWGRPGVHVIDLSVHFRHPNKTVSHYSQCQDRIITPDSLILCCKQHSSLRDWAIYEHTN